MLMRNRDDDCLVAIVIFTGDYEMEGWELHRCTSSVDLVKGGVLLHKAVDVDKHCGAASFYFWVVV